jgi:mono/diheme cytochrome c family protein
VKSLAGFALMLGCYFGVIQVAACGWHASRMNDQGRCEPGDVTHWLPDERCDQLPPPNTVAWRAPAPIAPPKPTRELIARGADRFSRFCAPCHGTLGDGKSIIARDMSLRPPRSLHDDKVVHDPDLAIYATISDGYGMMPAYRHAIADADRWAIVHYVRVLQRSQAMPVTALTDEQQREAAQWLK